MTCRRDRGLGRFPAAVAFLALCSLVQPSDSHAGTYGDAMAWYAEAAAQGDAQAQYLLAYDLETGARGVTDEAEARRWYNAASSQGHARASVRLALMQLQGRGGPADAEAARHSLAGAAEAGDVAAMSLLGYLLVAADGDRGKAYRWLTLAAEGGDGAAAANLAALLNLMSQAEIDAADQDLAAWRDAR